MFSMQQTNTTDTNTTSANTTEAEQGEKQAEGDDIRGEDNTDATEDRVEEEDSPSGTDPADEL